MSSRWSCGRNRRSLPSLEHLGTRELLSGTLGALALNGLSPPALLPAPVGGVVQVDVPPAAGGPVSLPALPLVKIDLGGAASGLVARTVSLVLERTAPLLDLPVVGAPPVLPQPPGPGPISPPVLPPPVKVDAGAPLPPSVSGPLGPVSSPVPGLPRLGGVSPVQPPPPPANVAQETLAPLPAEGPGGLPGVAPALPVPVPPPTGRPLSALPQPRPSVDTGLLPGGMGAEEEAPDFAPGPGPSVPGPDEKAAPADGAAEAEGAPLGLSADFLLPSLDAVTEALVSLPALPPQAGRALYWLALGLAAAAVAAAVGQRGRSQARPSLPGEVVPRPLV